MNKGEGCITLCPWSTTTKCYSSYETNEETHEVGMTLLDNNVEQDTHVQAGEHSKIPPHLGELFNKSSLHLNEELKDRLAELLVWYETVFSRSDRIGNRQPPRRQPFSNREIEKEEIHKMLERGIVEPSRSLWASAIVLVTKRDGTTRFCVEYRRLNDVTIKNAYPLPRVDDCLDALAGSKNVSVVWIWTQNVGRF